MIQLFQRWYNRHFSQPGTVEFALVLICVFLTVYYLMWLVGPIVVALCLAFCLDWPVTALEKRGILSRKPASVLVMLMFCSLVVAVTVLIVPKIIKQGMSFYDIVISFSREAVGSKEKSKNEAVTGDVAAGKDFSVDITTGANLHNDTAVGEYDLTVHNSSQTVQSTETVTADHSEEQGFFAFGSSLRQKFEEQKDDPVFNISINEFDAVIAGELHRFVMTMPDPLPGLLPTETLTKIVRQSRIQISNGITAFIKTQLGPSVFNLVTWLVYLLIVPIFTFLMLYNKEDLQRRVRLFVLPNNQVVIRKFWPSIHRQIAGYIRGKLLHIIIITIANSLAFVLMGVNYALLLGFGVGLSVVIPYVGAVIIAVPVVLVALFQFGLSSTFVWIIIIYTVIQLLDSNVLTPMLFSKAMNLDAFSILAAILIFGGLWGFWGVFFAIPLATFIKTIVMQWPNEDLRRIKKQEKMREINNRNAAKEHSSDRV